jgi:hypothetical protein
MMLVLHPQHQRTAGMALGSNQLHAGWLQLTPVILVHANEIIHTHAQSSGNSLGGFRGHICANTPFKLR